MKVLIVTNMYPNPRNIHAGIFVAEQERNLKKFFPDIDVDVYYMPTEERKSEYLKSFWAIPLKLKKGNYDIMHIHFGTTGMFLLNPFFTVKIPVVMTLHGGDIQPEQGKYVQNRLCHHILKHVDYTFTLNTHMHAIAKEYCDACQIVPCSVNTSLFKPVSERTLTIGKKDVNIIFPSSPNRPIKDYPLFERTLKVMKDKYGINCHEQILHGFTRVQLAEFFNNADAVLMTSISEGSPQVVKEAMSCNCPVISTNVGDVEVVLNGAAGCAFVNEHEENALAEKLFLSLQGKIPGKSPRQQIFDLELDDKSITTKIYNVYKSILARK